MDRWRVLVPTALILISLALAGCGGGDEKLPFGLQSEVATDADRVRAMAFAPDGRLFFGEQYTGNVRILQADGSVQSDPFVQLGVANYIDLDWGLTGIAIDPNFASNHYVYVFYTEPLTTGENPVGRPKLVRFTEENGRATNETVVSESFPDTVPVHPGYNANGRIHFGPDGNLYASMGDYDIFSDQPQRLAGAVEPIGKILRMNAGDGSAASGNPFADDPNADSRVYARGFREPFPFTFHPQTGSLYGTDNTTATCEELNIIAAGGNYGWPDVGGFPFADCSAGDQVDAIHLFSREGTAPTDYLSFTEVSGLVFASAARYPALGDSLFVCESYRSKLTPAGNPEGEGVVEPGVLRRLVLAPPDNAQVTGNDVIVKDCKGDVAVSPDGTVYYTNDSQIRRLLPGEPTQ
jgi:glucose/arabinose dehydrogenase